MKNLTFRFRTAFVVVALAMTAATSVTANARSRADVRSQTNDDAEFNSSAPLTACQATRLIEMRNALIAAHYLCKNVVRDVDYDYFYAINRARIIQANNIAVASFMKRDGTRYHFDKLDTLALNQVARQSSLNPNFCREVGMPLRAMMVSVPIDVLLAKQRFVPVPACK